MTRKELFLATLRRTKVVSVVRIGGEADLSPMMKALCKGGVRIIEITATTPGCWKIIRHLKEAFSDREDCFVGAGTVLSMDQFGKAADVGADFIVSPVFDEKLVASCVAKDLPVMPGAMTPTEIHRAWIAGASVVKVFPGGVCTPGFFADMRGPFPGIPLMPTGNVNAKTAPEYVKAGAVAVGIGKALASEAMIRAGDWDSIERQARAFVSLLSSI